MFHRSSLLLLLPLFVRSEDSLQTVDDAEFSKLIAEEKYVVALFCTKENTERCEEFEGELTGIREDLIDVMDGDGWVVKLEDSGVISQFYIDKIQEPEVIMFRNSLPVIYTGETRQSRSSRTSYNLIQLLP